jgi:Spy/CpxP family protein refolding chaperone
MRTQKTMTALTVIAVLLLAFSASAQLDKLKNTTPEERAEVQTAFMKSKLGLTADQTTKVADINLRYAQKMDPVIKGSSGLLTKRRQMNEVNREKEAELKQALSAEQFQKYLDSKEEMREKFEEEIEEKARGGQ